MIQYKLLFEYRSAEVMSYEYASMVSKIMVNAPQEMEMTSQMPPLEAMGNGCSVKELTSILHLSFPVQLPEHLKIVQLPNGIICRLTSLLLRLPAKTQLQGKHTTNKIWRGEDGRNTSILSESGTTYLLIPSPKDSASECAEVCHGSP